MERPHRHHQLARTLTTCLALLALAAAPATALAAAQWQAPAPVGKVRKLALLMVKTEHSTYGGKKSFSAKACAKKSATRYVCNVVASFPNYGGGTLVEKSRLKIRLANDGGGLITDAYASLRHVVTSCPPGVQPDPECATSTTEQHWTWDTTTGGWKQDTNYPPIT